MDSITYVSGRVKFSDEFTTHSDFKGVLPLLKRSKEKALDVGAWLYFVYSPKSIYRKMPSEERMKMLLKDGRLRDPQWLQSIVSDERMQRLVQTYVTIETTPGERLYTGLVNNIERYLDELSKVAGSDLSTDTVKLVKKGKELFDSLKSIEAIMNEESAKKIKAGYVPRKFERKKETV